MLISTCLYTHVIIFASMKAKITHFALVVKNQDAALDFYIQKVGFEKKADITGPGGYRWVTVGPKNQDLELMLQPETNDPNSGSSQWHSSSIFMDVDDVKKAFDELKALGVQFKQVKPDEHAYGISATFSDPDGNLFQMNQRPDPSAWKK